MPSTPKTRNASTCPDCGLVPLVPTDPVQVLRRLPASLWNQDPPTDPGNDGAVFDEAWFDLSRFDAVPASADATLQWNLARILSELKDRLVRDLKQARALQLGLGDAEVIDNAVVSVDPRAAGADMDRLGQDYGVGRPPGFTDCCYWRLLVLLLFQPGTSPWRLLEVAELYTGVRPRLIESPSKVILAWPTAQPIADAPAGTTFFDAGQFADQSAFFDAVHVAVTNYDAFFGGGAAGLGDTFFGSTGPGGPPGLQLRQALEQVKPAGVFVDLAQMPIAGTSGCLGATTRAMATRRAFYGAALEDG